MAPIAASLIDDQAKRLADFFNGEVVALEGPLPELEQTNTDPSAGADDNPAAA